MTTRELQQPQERTITESTGTRLIASIADLNTSMAIANTRLQDIAIKFDRQEALNSDIEKRMKEREIGAVEIVQHIDSVKSAADLQAQQHDARIATIENWKKSVNGVLIATGTTVFVTVVLGVLYLVFGAQP